MRINKFLLSYILLVAYEVSMAIFKLDGFSLSKIVLTMLPWLSFFMMLQYFISDYLYIKYESHQFIFSLLLAIFFINSACIIRSFFESSLSLQTNFGNVFNALSLLVPFAFAFGIKSSNLVAFNTMSVKLLLLGNITFIFCLLIGIDERTTVNLLFSLCGSAIFLIGTAHSQKGLNKLLILTSSISLFSFSGLVLESRAMLMRIPLLFISSYIGRFSKQIPRKILIAAFLLTLIMPLYYAVAIVEGNSIFANLSSDQAITSNESSYFSTTDTRTFLYTEVYDDLAENHHLIFGKGSGGTYFSNYFYSTGGDSATRLTVEVGFLALLLKTGIVGAGLTLAAIYAVAYLALFKSNNRFVFWLGLMLLLHGTILFVENLIAMNTYNFLIWFFIGVCSSNKIRSMNNTQIHSLFNSKPV